MWQIKIVQACAEIPMGRPLPLDSEVMTIQVVSRVRKLNNWFIKTTYVHTRDLDCSTRMPLKKN